MPEQITESQMHTIEDAVRLLSKHGLLEIVIGDNILDAGVNQCRVGPLTSARNQKTGELCFLLFDSSLPVSLKDLTFRMTIGESDVETDPVSKAVDAVVNRNIVQSLHHLSTAGN